MIRLVKIQQKAFFIFLFLLFFSSFTLMMPASVAAVGISNGGYVDSAITSQNLLSNKTKSHYELVLFYNVSCHYCFQFCRTLKEYALQNRMPVKAFKLTQKTSPYFPNSILVNQRIIEQYFGQGVQIAVPALFVLNPNNMHLYPVSSGNLTSDELKVRMDELMQKIKIFEGRSHAWYK